MSRINDPFSYSPTIIKKRITFLLEIDQEIFNIMYAKSMHQITRIELRNAKFPYTRGRCPLATLDPPGQSITWAPLSSGLTTFIKG